MWGEGGSFHRCGKAVPENMRPHFFGPPPYSMVGHSALVPPHGSTLIGVFCSRWPCALHGNGSAGASCRPDPDNARRVADGLNGTKTCSR